MTKILRPSIVLAALVLPASCGGGGNAADGNAANSAELRLSVCSLGCSSGTCSVRKIAVNEDIVFTFNDNILASSVSLTSIGMVNLTNGGSPSGEFLVDGNQITFRPEFVDGENGISFGFEESNTYSLTLAASPGDSAVVRSRGGRPNTTLLNCTFEATGIRDYVPGPPVASVSPSVDSPPESRSFDIVLSFNDIVRSSQLIGENGTSPTVNVNLVSIDGFGNEVVFPLDGTFIFQGDLDARETRLIFVPLGQLPTGQNGTRWVRIDVSNQVTDLVGNRLVNAGSFVVPLADESGATGTIHENFATTAKLDPLKSAPGVWEGTGVLDSGLDPVSLEHPGGGSGVFGSPDMDGYIFDTGEAPAAGMVYSELLNTEIAVDDGVLMYSSIEVPIGRTASATGTRPLRLFVRGSVDVRGTLDFGGEDGEVNFGMYRPEDERLAYGSFLPDPPPPPSQDMLDLLADPAENIGGAGGRAALAGGAGGHGGAGWHTVPGYYNDSKIGWFSEHSGGAAAESRYVNGVGSEAVVGVHGSNGGRVGGDPAVGAPLPPLASGQIVNDALAGSGMGTWAWPPKSNTVPLPNQIGSGVWYQNLDGTQTSAYFWSKVLGTNFFRYFSIFRARGGGGGGYWTDGKRGDIHDGDPLAFDSYGELLSDNEPNFDRYNATLGVNHQFNGDPFYAGDVANAADREAWTDALQWDTLSTRVVADGAGGVFTDANPYYTLDPSLGYLRGGAGGGGAGLGQYGSFNLETNSIALTVSDIESYRDCDGAGGGAGGGAVQMQIARDLNLSGKLNLRGGDGGSSATKLAGGYTVDTNAWFACRAGDAGGGGGAGGGLLLQVTGTTNFVGGTIDLRGGAGGMGAVGNDGGEGGAGLLRFESDQPFSLGDAAGIVLPIEAYDLATRPEFAMTGANQGSFTPDITGSVGDITVPKAVGVGSVTFNGNATGIASEWYQGDEEKLFLIFDSWKITVEWSNGTGAPQTIVYNDANPTEPGTTPIWAAFQTAYGFKEGGVIEAEPGSEYGWIVPGYNTAGGGNDELQAAPASTRLIRYQIVFDQDRVAARIGSNPGAYFHVTDVEFTWTE